MAALSDLNDIAEYIALDNLAAAKQLVQTVFTAVERLKIFPESGRVLPELEHLSYGEVVAKPSRVIYKYVGNEVSILLVTRAERDLHKFMLNKFSKNN